MNFENIEDIIDALKRQEDPKNLQCIFAKMRAGGIKVVWNFSENASDLVG